jgi:hypothetical protein
MKRLLMIAASVLAFAGAAQAEAPSLRSLPEAMLGGWCASGQITGDDGWSSSTYFRSKRGKCGGDWMRLRARGYVETVGEPVTCRFISIHQIDKDRFASPRGAKPRRHRGTPSKWNFHCPALC